MVGHSRPHRSSRTGQLVLLLRLARARFLITCLALYIMGAAWAVLLGATPSATRMLLGYLIVLTAQLSVSYSNDYFDVEVDRNATPTLVSGGSGILVAHPELREPARWIAIALIAMSIALGAVFAIVYAYPAWFVPAVAFGALLGWFYSAPPPRLAYGGLGELSTAVAGGFLVPVMGYLALAGQLTREGLLLTIPSLCYGIVFIVAVEVPDEEADRSGGKMTWVVRQGQRASFLVIVTFLVLGTVFYFFAARAWAQVAPIDFRVLGLLSLLPLVSGAYVFVQRPRDWQTASAAVNRIIIALTTFYNVMDAYLVVNALQ
jgi:1,4-dihydroxy-2-naphthoate polyprenyltransferase